MEFGTRLLSIESHTGFLARETVILVRRRHFTMLAAGLNEAMRESAYRWAA